MLGLLASEILLEEIDFVVLLDALLGVLDEIAGRVGVLQDRISQKLLLILGNFSGLFGIVFAGPATDLVVHTAVVGRNALGVNLINVTV